MITESYCAEKEALFSPGASLGERKNICDAAIATFSGIIHNAVGIENVELGKLGGYDLCLLGADLRAVLPICLVAVILLGIM